MATIRCLVLSDTHDVDAFPHPDLGNAQVDVVLHCGDLTMIGGLSNYRKALTNIQAIPAELKLVIAGNHDVSLDARWWADNLDEEDDDPEEPAKAKTLFDNAKNHGIHLLDEGLHRFTLQDGRQFSIFASPYTPEFGGYAFSYAAEEDHFNNTKSTIPNDVDIVMTHGPPLPPSPSASNYLLDVGHKGEHCGCPKLFRAIKRSKPQLHCFGHIHEGYGVEMVTWEDQQDEKFEILTMDGNHAAPGPFATVRGKTLLVNAAITTHGDIPNNKPWVVDIKACRNLALL